MLRTLMIICLSVCVLFVGVSLIGQPAVSATPVSIPDLKGKTVEDAKKALDPLGLKLSISGGDPAPTEGEVYKIQSQLPEVGKTLSPGEEVKVKLYGPFVKKEEPKPTNSTTTSTTPPAPKKPPPTGGLFVAAAAYYPKLPEKLPEGTKFKDYLKTMNAKDATFQPSAGATFLHLSSKAQGYYAKDFFDKGKQFALPVKLQILDKKVDPHKEWTIQGAQLLESKGTYDSYEALVKDFPADRYGSESANPLASAKVPVSGDAKKEPPTQLQFLEFETTDGKFLLVENTAQSDTRYEGGPATAGWTEADKQANIQYLQGLFEMMDCFVATAVFQSWMAPQLRVLRQFRDQFLYTTQAGTHLANEYYRLGPVWAETVRTHPVLQTLMKPAFNALVFILESLDMDHPAVQSFYNELVAGLDWLLGPWLESQPGATVTP